MAKLGTPIVISGGYGEQMKELGKLEIAAREALKAGKVVGTIFSEQVADGYALYLVEKESPLTLRHIDAMDGYTIRDYAIRGLTLADVKEQMAWKRKYL